MNPDDTPPSPLTPDKLFKIIEDAVGKPTHIPELVKQLYVCVLIIPGQTDTVIGTNYGPLFCDNPENAFKMYELACQDAIKRNVQGEYRIELRHYTDCIVTAAFQHDGPPQQTLQE